MRLMKKCALLTAVAGACIATSAFGQALDTNLVANPGFENVDVNTAGPFTSVLLLNWVDLVGANDDAYAYPYSSLYSGSPVPPNSGDYHYSGGFGTAANEVQLSQEIDLSGGAAGPLIQSGSAFFNLSAYFSTYFTQGEASLVRVQFLDVNNVEIPGVAVAVGGTAFINGLPVTNDRTDWGRDTIGGPIPAAARKALISIVSAGAATNFDGYVDNVDFKVTATNPGPNAFSISVPTVDSFFQGGNFILDWSDSFNATTYSVVVSANANLSSPVLTRTGVTTSETAIANEIPNGVWYLQVTAVNSAGSIASSNGPVRFAVVRGGSSCPADFNGQNGLTVQDIFDFLNAWFAGCP
jgi:hypothetical protein